MSDLYEVRRVLETRTYCVFLEKSTGAILYKGFVERDSDGVDRIPMKFGDTLGLWMSASDLREIADTLGEGEA